jgi:hypothetical protein
MDHYANKRKQCSEVPASLSPPRHVPVTTSPLHFILRGKETILIGLALMNLVLSQI